MKRNTWLLAAILVCLCPMAGSAQTTDEETFLQVKDTMTFCVMGNSISTYENYIPAGYYVYYGSGLELERGIQVGDTWWMQLSRTSGMTFLNNVSWSGSRVACDGETNKNAPFTSNHRVINVGRAGAPDAIIIAGGTNDWAVSAVPMGEYSTTVFNDSVTFRGAYTMLLHKLTTRYPDMKIIYLSIFPRGNGINDKNSRGWSMAEANISIRTIARQFGAIYVDCSNVPFSSNWTQYTIDYLHPTTAGHKLIADCINKALISQKLYTSKLAQKAEVDEAPCLLDLTFDADGIRNDGTYQASRIGQRGGALTVLDERTQTYMGSVKSSNTNYYYATYDEDSPLGRAFNNNVTWETLVRLDGLSSGNNTCDNTCYLSSDQDGGWSFYNGRHAATFTYRHKSGYQSYMKNLAGDSIMVPGRFYHMVVTMDRVSHIMRYYVNGKLVSTGTRCATDMEMPHCGSSVGKRNMWICLGGDCATGTFMTSAEKGSAATFVFSRIYDGALTQKAALALYNDYVKRFTEPDDNISDDMLLDCRFTPDGAENRAAAFGDWPLTQWGEFPIQYNPDLHCYEAQFTGKRAEGLMFPMGNNPAMMNQIANGYTLEVYCRTRTAKPATTMRPAGFTNGYGPGLSMNAQGKIGYATTTIGYKADGSTGKTQWSWLDAGSLTDAYTHYMVVYDRMGLASSLYVNGELAFRRSITTKEGSMFEWLPSEWLAIGGDANGSMFTATMLGSYPFDGDIASVRMWSRALSADEVQEIARATTQGSVTLKTLANGYAAVCVPFATRVPEGFEAFIIYEVTTTNAYLRQVGKAGDYLPYGAAVLLKGPRVTEFTLTAVDLPQDAVPADGEEGQPIVANVEGNLLRGAFSRKKLQTGDGYYQHTSGNTMNRITSACQQPAFSCYLPSDNKRATITYKLVETGIEGLPAASDTDFANALRHGIFNLAGQRIPSPTRGLYIINGKKILLN